MPLVVLTADRPAELRIGANQAIDQIKLYGAAVRWFCEAGLPEARPGVARYWRSLACQAWAHAAGRVGGLPGPVHLNLPFREPLVPGGDEADGQNRWTGAPAGSRGLASRRQEHGEGRPPEMPWTERGVVVCGDGDYDAPALVELAGRAGWPVLAEPSSGARRGPGALSAYQYLLATPEFVRAHQPDLIVSAGRPGSPGRSSPSSRRIGAQARGGRAGARALGRPAARRDRRRRGPPADRGPGRHWIAGTAGWTAGSGRTRRRAARWTPCSTRTRA